MVPTTTSPAHRGPRMSSWSRQKTHHEDKNHRERTHRENSNRLTDGVHLAAAGAGGLRATTILKSGSGEPPTTRSVLSTTKWS